MTVVDMDAFRVLRPAARPVTFEQTVGLFTPARGLSTQAAVLFLSPWGLEELCVRKAWRELADRLSEVGVASLRYDHPGTGDALDPSLGTPDSRGLTPMVATAKAAAVLLTELSGIDRLIVIAQGFGALLVPALLAPAGLPFPIDRVALLAPVTSGRRYLRELSLWSKVVDEGLGLPAGSSGPGTSIAGLVMDEELATAVRGADLKTFKPGRDTRFLIAERQQSDADAALSVQLQADGADVTRIVFAGYADLVSNPTLATTPETVFQQVTTWIATCASTPEALPARSASSGVLDGGHFTECPMRFGAGDRLYGILCMPAHAAAAGTALLLGTGYDRQSGWARSTVETARALAASGIASLRFDAAGIADSPPSPESDRQVLYSPGQVADVCAALDLLEAIGLPRAVFVGRCSGAYLAFQAALADPRCRGVIAVNILTFAWDPRDDVDQMIRYNPRSLDDYRRRAFRVETAYRLLSGKIDVANAAGNIVKIVMRRLSKVAAPVLGSLSVDARLHNTVHRAFRHLRERSVPVSLVYSEGDVGLARLGQQFGRDGHLLARYPNVARTLIADADHNMTPRKARDELCDHIRETILAIVSGQGSKAS